MRQVCHIVCQALAQEHGLNAGAYDASLSWNLIDPSDPRSLTEPGVEVTLRIKSPRTGKDLN